MLKIGLLMKKDDSKIPETALQVLQGLLEKGNSPLAEDFKRYRLKRVWPEVIGSTLASKCSPVGFSNGVLYIWVVNATWMNQLFFARTEILKKVNAYMGKSWAGQIRFTMDARDLPADSKLPEDPPEGR
jgi:predicted nucleic acid-binding Zn ribbon protein